jgi:GTPase SAR1 family protein
LRINSFSVKLLVWDGPGEKMEEFVEEGQLNAMDGLLYIFDLTDKQSFHQLEQLHHMIKKEYKKIGRGVCALLVGNKADLVARAQFAQESDRETDYLAEAICEDI